MSSGYRGSPDDELLDFIDFVNSKNGNMFPFDEAFNNNQMQLPTAEFTDLPYYHPRLPLVRHFNGSRDPVESSSPPRSFLIDPFPGEASANLQSSPGSSGSSSSDTTTDSSPLGGLDSFVHTQFGSDFEGFQVANDQQFLETPLEDLPNNPHLSNVVVNTTSERNLKPQMTYIDDDHAEVDDDDFNFGSLQETKKNGSSHVGSDYSNYDLSIQSEVGFHDWKTNPKSHKNHRLSDFPQDAATQQLYVKRLMTAFRDLTESNDTDKVKEQFLRTNCADIDLEVICWELLLAARDAQEYGRNLTQTHAEKKFEGYETFRARFDAIIIALKESKLFCKSLISPSFVLRAADQPIHEIKRKGANRMLNSIKTRQNQAGKRAMQEGLVDLELRNWLGGKAPVTKEPLGFDPQEVHHPLEAERETPKRRVNGLIPRTPKSTPRKRTRVQEDGDGIEAEEPMKKKRRANGRNKFQPQEAANTVQTPRTPQARDLKEGSSITDPIPEYEQGLRGDHVQEKVIDYGASDAPVPFDRPYLSRQSDRYLADLDQLYRDRLTKLLAVNKDIAAHYNLFHLRWYARCYLEDFQQTRWYHKDLSEGEFGVGPIVFGPDSIGKHISSRFPVFETLALSRGDVYQGQVKEGSRLIPLKRTPGLSTMFGNAPRDIKKEVLGMAPNPFGAYHNDSQIEFKA